jgi:hypothetical protein
MSFSSQQIDAAIRGSINIILRYRAIKADPDYHWTPVAATNTSLANTQIKVDQSKLYPIINHLGDLREQAAHTNSKRLFRHSSEIIEKVMATFRLETGDLAKNIKNVPGVSGRGVSIFIRGAGRIAQCNEAIDQLLAIYDLCGLNQHDNSLSSQCEDAKRLMDKPGGCESAAINSDYYRLGI